MITTLVSSGSSLCEVKALEVAAKYKIRTEGFFFNKEKRYKKTDRFNLKEADDPKNADLNNILSSDGVLWFCDSMLPSDEFIELKNIGLQNSISFFRVVADENDIFGLSEKIGGWIYENGISSLMVKKDPECCRDISEFVVSLLESVIYVVLLKTDKESLSSPILNKPPDYSSKSYSVRSVIEDLIGTIPLKDRVLIANMKESDLSDLLVNLGITILSKYYWPANNYLREDCEKISGSDDMEEFEIAEVIIEELWKELKSTHKLRIMK